MLIENGPIFNIISADILSKFIMYIHTKTYKGCIAAILPSQAQQLVAAEITKLPEGK